MVAATKKVRIAENRALTTEHHHYREGEVVEVLTADAKTLVAEGWAEDVATPRARRRGPPNRASQPRKPLTVDALEAGEGERG
jgi:hypothetical protein